MLTPKWSREEAGVTRGRVAMLAVIGFFVAEVAEGSSFLSCAFAPAKTGKASTTARSRSAFTVDSMPGALIPMGFFDPLSFATDANEAPLKKYRVAAVAVIGCLVA